MLRMKNTVCIEASAGRVWDCLSAVEAIDLWVPAIKQAWCEAGQKRGVGIVRVCKLEKFVVREEFLEWDEGKSFKYVAAGAPMIKSASNRWSLEPEGDKTLVTSYAEIIVKGGGFGRPLEPFIYLATRLGFPNALAPLKYYIETGKSFTGKAKDLPRAPAFC